MSHPSARQSALYRLNPLMLSRISVAFAVIAAVWLTVASVHGEVIALVAAIAVVITGHAGRMLAGERAATAVEWGLAGCGMLAEFVVYAGIAAAVSFHAGAQLGIAGSSLSGTFIAGFGGVGPAGVWRLAIMAVILTALTAMVDVCVHGPARPLRARLFGPAGDIRLPLACLAVLLLGARAAFLVVIVLGVAALLVTIADGTGRAGDRGELRGYRGDGRLAVWIGKWVEGKVPPLPPLLVGLLVTGVLAALGLGNLSGILLLTPAEAMLLAAFASWHPHDGRNDWLVPPLLQAGEYVFLAEIGYAGRVWPAMTFAVVAAAGLRHLDLAYRVRGGLADGTDRRGFGWEGRMIIAGIAAAVGFAPFAYGALAVYLWYRLARDWVIGWSARPATMSQPVSRTLRRRGPVGKDRPVLSRYMGGVRPGAGFESPAAMRRRWLAGILAVSVIWAVLVAVFSTDHVHQVWGEIAAVGYGLALAVVLVLRHTRTADIALWLAFLGGLIAPLGWLAAHSDSLAGKGLLQPEVWVVANSGASLIHHGTPYTDAAILAGTQNPNAYNPYLPVMALFGLPRAFFNLGLLTDPRVWFGIVFVVVFWLAMRQGGARDPWRWTILVAGSPVIAFELAVGGTDVPMVAFLCLGFAFLWQRKPVLAGVALGIGASMKATAWPALLVAVALLAVRDGKRAVGSFTLAALGVIAVCVGPFIAGHPKALVENTIMFPLGLASVRSAASSPLPGHIIAATWPDAGHTIVVVLLALAGLAVAASLVFKPPRSVPRAVVLLAGAMTLMFVLAPSTRFGYFIYPAGLAIWLLAAWVGRKVGEEGELGEIAVSFLPARVPEGPPTT